MVGFFITVNSAQAATTKFLVIAPGQTYDGASAPNRYNPVTQVAGEQFVLVGGVFCFNDGTNLPINSFPNTTQLSSPATATFNPSGLFDLPDSYGAPPVSNSRRSGITVILEPSSNSMVAIDVAAAGGIGADMTQVYVQVIDHFTFTALPTFTAGSGSVITIQARDASNNLCDAFNGSAQLYALEANVDGGTANEGVINFTNGVYTGSHTFYHASPYAQFRVYKSNSPSVDTYQSFTIDPAPFFRLLIIGPGQTVRSGESGGIGRASASNTTTAQNAGSAFTLTVHACDAYWNTRTAGATTVTLTSEDPGFVYGGPQGFGGGSTLNFNSCELRIAGDGFLLMTATDSGAAQLNTDIVPLNPAGINNFTINNISGTTAGTSISLSAWAFDMYGNTVTSVSGSTSLEVLEGGVNPLSNANGAWILSPGLSSSSFSGDGNYSGSLAIRKAQNNYVVRIVHSVIGNTDSNSFNISANSDMRYIVFMPGQTRTPGEQFAGTWGRDGSPVPQQVGTPFNVSIVATDGYGNQVNRNETLTVWDGTLHLTVSDASASVAPNPIALSSGSAYPGFTLTVATMLQDLSVAGALFTSSSGTFTVYHSSVTGFAVSAGTAQTAGAAFPVVVTAQDQYYNPVTSYAGTVNVTCPELDYSNPTESVLLIPAGTPVYMTYSATAYWTLSGFSAGQRSFNTTVYRATTGTTTATLFVSDNADDTPSSYTGNIGQSQAMTVAPDLYTKMFCLVPNLQWRPGGIDSSGTGAFNGDGYQGAPLSQQAGTSFPITISATDDYWNLITSANDQITTQTNPITSDIHDTNYTLVGGVRQINATFNADANYTITIVNASPGVSNYTTPYTIICFTLDHFEILPNPVPSLWTAGVPQWCTITAYEDAVTIATTFNGAAELRSTLDHDTTLQAISPQTIVFTLGVWYGNITVYRANNYWNENNNFWVRFGNLVSASSTFWVQHASADRLLVLESGGMEHFPGIAPDIDPLDDFGIQGEPAIQTAGTAITKISFMLCDSFWNKVTQTAEADNTVTIECSDPYPATIENLGAFIGGTQSVTLTAGVHECVSGVNGLILYTVNGTSGQRIGVTNGAGRTPYVLEVDKNRVPVRHAEPGEGFQFTIDPIILSSVATAGIPFQVTVTAIDAYGNTLDSLNGAALFPTYSAVDLGAQTDAGGNKSIWPTQLGTLEANRWQEGVSYPWVYSYKQVSGSQFLTATHDFGYGNRSGTSGNFSVDENFYARIVPIVTGMDTPDAVGAGGTYSGTYDTAPPQALVSVFNNFGTPTLHTAGNIVSLQAYTCDIYGNGLRYPDVTISMSTSDPYAPVSANVAVVPTNGYANFTTFRFHTRGASTITCVDEDVTTTTAGTTPLVTVVSGPYFGLQAVVPGLIAIEGSGTTNVSNVSPVGNGAWYNGVTPANPSLALNAYNGSAQFAGSWFPVSIQAVDLYGNIRTGTPANIIELRSDDLSGLAVPSSVLARSSSLDTNGLAHFFAQQRTEGPRFLKPHDMANGTIKDGDAPDYSGAVVRVVQETDVAFVVEVEGVLLTDNTPVYVDAAPNTFNMRVEVRYTGTGEVVSTTQSFLMEHSLTPGTYVPANGTLGLTAGGTTFGVAVISGQSYDTAENFYIRVRDAGGTNDPDVGYSPEIRVMASAPARIELTADTISYSQDGQMFYQIQSNNDAVINATVYDANNNQVSGAYVTFQIIDPVATNSYLVTTAQNNTANANGLAYTTFRAGASNLEHTIRASTASVTEDLIMFVTVTNAGGVYPNPFNPLVGYTNIDYNLNEDASVTIEIYTLLGDLVWSKDIPAGDPRGGHQGVNSVPWNGKNNQGVTVANGGYICTVKSNDQEVARFKIGVYKER